MQEVAQSSPHSPLTGVFSLREAAHWAEGWGGLCQELLKSREDGLGVSPSPTVERGCFISPSPCALTSVAASS